MACSTWPSPGKPVLLSSSCKFVTCALISVGTRSTYFIGMHLKSEHEKNTSNYLQQRIRNLRIRNEIILRSFGLLSWCEFLTALDPAPYKWNHQFEPPVKLTWGAETTDTFPGELAILTEVWNMCELLYFYFALRGSWSEHNISWSSYSPTVGHRHIIR